MDVHELSEEQMVELKQFYLESLVNDGIYAATLGVDYNEPSYWDLAHADEIVPDELVFSEYEGVEFVNDDFFCTAN